MTKNLKQIIIVFAVSAILIVGLAFLISDSQSGALTDETATETATDEAESPATDTLTDGPLSPEEQVINNPNPTNSMNPIATLNTNQGQIKLELFADQMPVTVANFTKLANEGFYNNTKFHRVIDDFMIQGGDPNSRGDNESIYGQGGPGYTIQDEFVSGELLTNTRGTISMANTGQPNSGGSQWFINLANNTDLDFNKEPLTSKHPVFGRVIEGMTETVDKIATTETKSFDIPVSPIIIETVTITEGEG